MNNENRTKELIKDIEKVTIDVKLDSGERKAIIFEIDKERMQEVVLTLMGEYAQDQKAILEIPYKDIIIAEGVLFE